MIENLINKKLEDGFYYFQLHNIFIKSKINRVRGDKSLTKYLMIDFECGHIDIHDRSGIVEIKRPENMLLEFDWCYAIKNENEEFLGYIGKPSYQI